MKELFPDIPHITFEGQKTDNPLAFRYYDAKKKIDGTSISDIMRFSMAYWHSLCALGTDPFGGPTMERPWNTLDPIAAAEMRVSAIFELTEKLGIPFFCFHDRDLAPEQESIAKTNALLDKIVARIKERMESSPVRVLWGTANLFTHPRYMNGAASSPSLRTFAHAAAQVKKALEVTKELSGQNYVFWGGREGYETLLNTDMKREREQLASFFHMAVAYAQEIGFTGQLLIEPKPKEPTKHQYDFDVASVIGFLEQYGLTPFFKINIETNHATLAGHTMHHEVALARSNGVLGNIDANSGDTLLGWDTDQFPVSTKDCALVMYEVLQNGGLQKGGLNFDAKVRRASWRPVDLIYAHVAGIDTYTHGMLIAKKLLKEQTLKKHITKRYAEFDTSLGKKVLERTTTLKELETFAIENPIHRPESGAQEMLELLLERAIHSPV